MRRFLQRSAANGALTRCATKSPQAYSCGTSRKRNTVRLDDGGTAVEKLCIIRDKSLPRAVEMIVTRSQVQISLILG